MSEVNSLKIEHHIIYSTPITHLWKIQVGDETIYLPKNEDMETRNVRMKENTETMADVFRRVRNLIPELIACVKNDR